MCSHCLGGEIEYLCYLLVLMPFHKKKKYLALAFRQLTDNHKELSIHLLLEKCFLTIIIDDVFLEIINGCLYRIIALLAEVRNRTVASTII